MLTREDYSTIVRRQRRRRVPRCRAKSAPDRKTRCAARDELIFALRQSPVDLNSAVELVQCDPELLRLLFSPGTAAAISLPERIVIVGIERLLAILGATHSSPQSHPLEGTQS